MSNGAALPGGASWGAVGAGALGLGALGAGALLAYAVRGRSSDFFGPSVWHGDRTRKSIALTFDDGPSESTPELLEILAQHRVPATFFMCGQNVARLPSVAREVASAGHAIGNHSDSHPRFDFCSSEFIYRELASAQEKIAAHAGVEAKLFRAPYGVRWFGLRSAQEKLDLLGVMWTLIAHDWRWPAARVGEFVGARPRGGEIVCLHDGRTTQNHPDIRVTLEAMRFAIPLLQERGFRFETVHQILCPTN